MSKAINNLKFIAPATQENVNIVSASIATILETINATKKERQDFTCAVEEALNNVVDHAYIGNNYEYNKVVVDVKVYDDRKIIVKVSDKGRGIQNVSEARSPLYSTGCEDKHSGMGFTIMEAFANLVEVKSIPGAGTTVKLTLLLT